MYQVELAFKGFAKQAGLLTTLPMRIIKEHELFIQEFNVYSEKASPTTENGDSSYYFDIGIVLFIKDNTILDNFLDEVSKKIRNLSADHKIDLNTSSINFEYLNEEMLSLEDAAFCVFDEDTSEE